MQLSNYICNLLYRYECVILPGLGAFITQTKPAHIDLKTHTFYPPAKTLSFNRHLQTNDGLLANHIAGAENITYELALSRLRTQIKNYKSALENGEVVMIESIGELRSVRNSQIEFSPLSNANFLTDSFGLAPFVSAEVARVSEVSSEKETVVVPIKKSSIPVWRYAAIGLIAIGFASMGGLFVYNNQVQEHNLTEKQKANTLVENQIQQATFVVNPSLSPVSIEVKKPKGSFHIIAGAFRMEENADSKIEQLKEMGYPARLLGVNRYGLHQVVYNSFENREDALIELRKVQRAENPDAWLLVQEVE
jgi:hypothetical protein